MTAKDPTAAARKAAERQRHKDAGRTEVRGIYAPQELHADIRASAAKMVARKKTKRTRAAAAMAKEQA
jgi:hypothetical protein